jgi:ribonuclease Z
MYINYEIVVQEVYGGEIVYQGEGYKIHALPLRHTKPCLAYCLEEEMRPGVFDPESALSLGVPRGPLWSTLQSGNTVQLESGKTVRPEQVMGPLRPGRKFSFVTDTTWVPELPAFVRASDMLICEGMFGEELGEDAADKKHLTAVQAAQIAKEGQVEELGLIHYSPRYTARELKQLLDQAKKIFPRTFLTRDLQVIDLPFKERPAAG